MTFSLFDAVQLLQRTPDTSGVADRALRLVDHGGRGAKDVEPEEHGESRAFDRESVGLSGDGPGSSPSPLHTT